MDSAVALVQAYLRINGYFTVTEYPVIAARRDGTYRTATDLDVLAFRFPKAGRLVPGRRPGLDDDQILLDAALGVPSDHADMLVGEVKEGRAELNDAANDPSVLRAVLASFGCCSREEADAVAAHLLRSGRVTLPNGHTVRTAILASVTAGADTRRHLVISLSHVVSFLREYLATHWELLRHSDHKDPAFGFLMTIAKAEHGT